jgi:hypothetical protein
LTDLIINEIKLNINLIDKEIALSLKKKYPKVFQTVRLDSLRRRIGTIREENDLKRQVSKRNLLDNDIKLYLNKYKDNSDISIAKKLHLKYPNYKLRSILAYVHYKKHWDI